MKKRREWTVLFNKANRAPLAFKTKREAERAATSLINEGWDVSLLAPPKPADIRVTNAGSIFLLRPLTKKARAWLKDSVDPEAQWFGGALVVEPRYVADIVTGARENGLTVI